MAGDDETALLAAGHIEAELLFRGEGEELMGESGHVGDEFSVNAVIDNLEDALILISLNNLLANLGLATINFVDAGEGDEREGKGTVCRRIKYAPSL